MPQTNNISIIDLNHLEATKALDVHQMIFRDSFMQIAKTIQNKVTLDINVKRTEKFNPHRNYNFCYFINGGRGMGKSTFLRALKNYLTHPDRQKEDQPGPRIDSLADLDPTVLADGEIFFIHVLSQIHEKIRKLSSEHFPNSEDQKSKMRSAVDTISSMSKGLRLLSAPNNGISNSLTAELFIEESVEQYISSAKLRNKFAELMDTLCQLANVHAFLITIDDADMNFNKCSEVMETVRKYMLCPHLIFVFAGDLKLYTLVVRGMQLQHFGELSLKYDHERKEHRIELLDNLEEQYILKLFPTENRVNLTSISDLISSQGDTILMKEDDNSNKIMKNIHAFIRQYISHIVPTSHIPLLGHYIENMTTRTLLQLLRYWMQYAVLPQGEDEQESASKSKAAMGLTNGILHIASHALIKHKVNVNAIHGGDFPELMGTVLSHCLAAENPLAASRLIPQSGSDSYKIVAFYLSSEVARQTEANAAKLRYLCRVFPCLQIIRAIQEKDKPTDMQDLEKKYILRAAAGMSSRQWAAICTAKLTPDKRSVMTKHFGNGGLRLMKDAQKKIRYRSTTRAAKDRDISLLGFDRIGVHELLRKLLRSTPGENSDIQATSDFAFTLAFYYSLSRDVGDNGELYYLSVLNLVFFMLDCIDVLSMHRDAPRMLCEARIRDLMEAQAGIPIATDLFNLTETEKDVDEVEKDTTYRDYLRLLSSNGSNVENVASDIYDWWTRIDGSLSPSFAVRLADCWEAFLNKCTLLTKAISLTSQNASEFPECGSLFVSFMRCFTDAIRSTLHDDDGLSFFTNGTDEMIESFPLWQALRSAPENAPELWGLVNRANIGAMLYTGKLPQKSKKPKNTAKNAATKKGAKTTTPNEADDNESTAPTR